MRIGDEFLGNAKMILIIEMESEIFDANPTRGLIIQHVQSYVERDYVTVSH